MTALSRIERIGTANPGNQLAGAQPSGETLYVSTRSVSPFTVAAFDPESNRVTDRYELPIEDGPWPVTGFGSHASTTHDDPYFGVYGVGNLYRLVDGTGLQRVASFPDVWSMWDLDATADGTIYAGTFPESTLFASEVDADEVREFGSAHPDEHYARAVAVGDGTLYVGVGAKRARLMAIDRTSGDREDLLPEPLRERSMVDAIILTDDHIVASVRGRDRETPAALAVLDRDDPDSYHLVEPDDLVWIYGLAHHDGRIYAAARRLEASGPATVLCRYDLADQSFAEVHTTPTEVGCCAVSVLDDRILVTDDYGAVWTYDPGTGEYGVVDLADAGLPPRAELPQSLTVHGTTPIVAGHRKLHVHDVAEGAVDTHDVEAGSVDTARLPGEGKAMASVEDRVYAAVYKHAFFVEFDPADPDPDVVATVGHRQNRPRTLHGASGLVLMGTVPDSGEVGGAVAAYDPATGELAVDRHVVPGQSIRRITSIDGTAYLASERRGGGGSDPGETTARIVAWDPVERAARWDCEPVSDAETIVDLLPVDGGLLGVTAGGESFRIDPADGEPVAVDRLPLASGESVGRLAAVDGRVYGVTDRRLYRVDPASLAVETVLDDLDATWYNEPDVAVDNRNRLYLVDDFDLVRVTLS